MLNGQRFLVNVHGEQLTYLVTDEWIEFRGMIYWKAERLPDRDHEVLISENHGVYLTIGGRVAPGNARRID